jgi:hypothetical protein
MAPRIMSVRELAETRHAIQDANDLATLLALAQSIARQYPRDPDARRLLTDIAAKRERIARPAVGLVGPFELECEIHVDGALFRVGLPAESDSTRIAHARDRTWYVSISGAWTRLIFAPLKRADGDPPWPEILEPHVRAAVRAHER